MTRKQKIITGAVLSPFIILAIAIVVVWMVNPWLVKEGWIYMTNGYGVNSRNVDTDGIDVSHYNGRINWDMVAENKNIKFVYVKATQGVGCKDRLFRRNMREAKDAGLEVGAYHFFTKKKSGEQQFEFFRKTVGHKYIGTMIPMVDVEPHGVDGMKASDLRRELKVFCDLITKEYGRKPVIYTNCKIFNDRLNGEFDDYYIWICRYGMKPNLKRRSKYNIWQFSEHGRVDGIRGYTDLNTFTEGMSIEKLKF